MVATIGGTVFAVLEDSHRSVTLIPQQVFPKYALYERERRRSDFGESGSCRHTSRR